MRTIPAFTRLLAAAFLLAQLAGVVSSSQAKAEFAPRAIAGHVQHQHMHDHDDGGQAHHHGDQSGDPDRCCALHVFFAGILPPAIAIGTATMSGTRLVAAVADRDLGLPPGSLDRPPRPLC